MTDIELYKTMLALIDRALDNDNAFGISHNDARAVNDTMDVIAELNNRINEEQQKDNQ